MQDIDVSIRTFIAKNILFSGNKFPYKDNESFLETGIVDSQGVMELVAFVEDSFGITVDDTEITPDNFDSVQKLAHFIQKKIVGSNGYNRLSSAIYG